MIVRAGVSLAGHLVYVLALIPACLAVSGLYLRVFWNDMPVPMDGFAFVWLAILGPGWVGHLLVLLYVLFRRCVSTTMRFLALQLCTAAATAGLMGILFLVGDRIAVDSLVWTLAPYAILPAIATAVVYKLGRRHLAPRRAERSIGELHERFTGA
jgi:hypothetical protein